ncbi:SDR family NAD(P)-dependent oxidoreductase [Mycolicibacterium sp. BiH015]|uniref:SDR family NAD(P)-dependent oxidoreductase n=1 Tax=Mycolicibacterium sp. BiH015 TaxID=3018808 RepID=UPI0022E1E264|nr:SDR family NAD(P)-dependent oxidoreductase [Mycolicibacterium sp. BiH015]MDA2893265.1 SDR family NAD(P)-dependent oxidoreductase [Mycolicibacterium sp. BiH015]
MIEPRRCLVTGASKGIGYAIADRLLADGHRVAMTARNREHLDGAARALSDKHGGRVLALPGDVTSAEQVGALFADVERQWGAVEVLACSAGTGFASALTSTTDEDWHRLLDVNLTAPFRCLRAAVPAMERAGWGRIVVVASIVAKRGEAQVSAYTASKHGVLGLVRAASVEYAKAGITVNAVCPGYVDTPMTDDTIASIGARTGKSVDESRALLARRQPIGRLIEADEVADAVSFCVNNAGITGQGIQIDGGALQS